MSFATKSLSVQKAIWKYRHQHCHWNRHWRRHCKDFSFAFKSFFEKTAFLFLLVLIYGISTTLLQILISLRFIFIHQKASVGVLERGYLNFRKDPSPSGLKVTAPIIPAYFLAKYSGWSSF